RGMRELKDGARAEAGRARGPGGGRKKTTELDPTIVSDLGALVESTTRGDPMSPLRWTCKSTSQLSTELAKAGHAVSPPTVAALLHAMDYSLQGNRKTREGTSHPDRNAQFEYINAQARD